MLHEVGIGTLNHFITVRQEGEQKFIMIFGSYEQRNCHKDSLQKFYDLYITVARVCVISCEKVFRPEYALEGFIICSTATYKTATYAANY